MDAGNPRNHAPAGRRAPLGPLCLASASPRRLAILRDAGHDPIVEHAPFDDSDLVPGDVTPAQWAAALSCLKAGAVARARAARSERPSPVLGADTIVVAGGRIIGKPADRAEAEAILRALADGRHLVITGATLLVPGRARIVLADVAEVAVGPLDPFALREYLDSGQWRGKAGAYNLSERLDAGWPIRFTGDPATIMGLPIRRLAPILDDLRRAREQPGPREAVA